MFISFLLIACIVSLTIKEYLRLINIEGAIEGLIRQMVRCLPGMCEVLGSNSNGNQNFVLVFTVHSLPLV